MPPTLTISPKPTISISPTPSIRSINKEPINSYWPMPQMRNPGTRSGWRSYYCLIVVSISRQTFYCHGSMNKSRHTSILSNILIYRIMDKKHHLLKLTEINDQYSQLIIDILMYAKHKIMSSQNIQDCGIIELLRKCKTSILRMFAQPEYQRLIDIEAERH